MKLSLAWISDHLAQCTETAYYLSRAQEIATKLSQSTAEIDAVESINLHPAQFTIATCTVITEQATVYYSPETGDTYTLMAAPDAMLNHHYLLIDKETGWQRAYYTDIFGYRESPIPAVYISPQELKGSWKQQCTWQDVRLIIDNKAITHRPDLWCHRGFAREIAALIGDTLTPLELLTNTAILATLPHSEHNTTVHTAACDRFALMRIENSIITAPSPRCLFRLALMDTRAINSIVDLTNYVMFDLGQPLHAYDADRLTSQLQVRQALSGESLILLDGTTAQLNTSDCVIADNSGPVALAGSMGGQFSSVTLATKQLLIEAAHFTPHVIRHSAQEHRLRTEASTRFEKGIDPEGMLPALARFATLYTCSASIPPRIQASPIVHSSQADSHTGAARSIVASHAALKAILGISLTSEQIIRTLTALGYQVTPYTEHQDARYHIIVPSWRFADVHATEDIAEDIVRLIGYNTIPEELPLRMVRPITTFHTEQVRAIKRHLAYGLHMQELYSYPFYDEQFLRELQLDPSETARIRNPVSEQSQRLVTSLIPALLKGIQDNMLHAHSLRFFEIAKVWHLLPNGTLLERKKLACIIYERNTNFSFYAGKNMLLSLFDLLRIPVAWTAASEQTTPWWDHAHTATITHNGVEIGTAGFINPTLQSIIRKKHGSGGCVFAAELDADLLIQYRPQLPQYQEPSKFQSTIHDISLLAPYAIPARLLQTDIQDTDQRIIATELIDIFESPAWNNQRALTFRITINNPLHTLTRAEIESIMHAVTEAVQKRGVTIR